MSAKVMGKRAARTLLKSCETGIASVLSYVETERSRFETLLGRFEVRVAVMLDEGADACGILGEDWRKWARGVLPGKSAPTVYRWRNAGKVARILIGPAVTDENGAETYPENILGTVPAATIGSLVPLYRILSDAKSDEDYADAVGLIRETYQDVLKSCDTFTEQDENGETIISIVPPSAETVLAAAEAASPTKRSGGKSSGGKSSGGKSSDATETTETDEDEGDEDESAETRRESSGHLVTVDAAAMEAASAPTHAILAGLAREHKVSPETVLAVSLAVLRLASEWGVSTVQAVLAAGTAAQDATENEDAGK